MFATVWMFVTKVSVPKWLNWCFPVFWPSGTYVLPLGNNSNDGTSTVMSRSALIEWFWSSSALMTNTPLTSETVNRISHEPLEVVHVPVGFSDKVPVQPGSLQKPPTNTVDVLVWSCPP